jgi:hypothetical protein
MSDTTASPIRVSQRVRAYGREDLGVGEVLRVMESGGICQADVVFEGPDGRRLETFPLDRLESAPDLCGAAGAEGV